jgi:hypothetical protein
MPAIFLIVMSTLSPAKDKQDGGKDAPKGGAPVTQADLEARVKLLEKVVADQQEELIRLGRFADGVAVGIGRLAVAGEASRGLADASTEYECSVMSLSGHVVRLAFKVNRVDRPDGGRAHDRPRWAPRAQYRATWTL